MADFLSRALIKSLSLGISFSSLTAAQADCPDTHALLTAITSLKMDDVDFPSLGVKPLYDVSCLDLQPVIPPALYKKAFMPSTDSTILASVGPST